MDIKIRQLSVDDYHKGYMKLLGQLSVAPPVS